VIKGHGTVATGQIAAGTVSIGDVLQVEADGSGPVQVVCRGIEMFRKTLTSATVGDNVGLLLDGVTREQLAPGTVLRGH
jgi:elongation factor Tu